MNPLDLLALVCGLVMLPFLPAMYREIRGADRDRPKKLLPDHVVRPIRAPEVAVLIPVIMLIGVVSSLLALGVIA